MSQDPLNDQLKIQKRRPGRPRIQRDVKELADFSRRSARDCRTRKKIRYQYLEGLVGSKEKAIFKLRAELNDWKQICKEYDVGVIPKSLNKYINQKNNDITMVAFSSASELQPESSTRSLNSFISHNTQKDHTKINKWLDENNDLRNMDFITPVETPEQIVDKSNVLKTPTTFERDFNIEYGTQPEIKDNGDQDSEIKWETDLHWDNYMKGSMFNEPSELMNSGTPKLSFDLLDFILKSDTVMNDSMDIYHKRVTDYTELSNVMDANSSQCNANIEGEVNRMLENVIGNSLDYFDTYENLPHVCSNLEIEHDNHVKQKKQPQPFKPSTTFGYMSFLNNDATVHTELIEKDKPDDNYFNGNFCHMMLPGYRKIQ